MKKIFITLLFSIILVSAKTQTLQVAILDFENTSGKKEFDAFGKALSNMLITDLKNNIHPNKVVFFERSQLIKLLEEQKLQKGKDFDATTAVKFGKISGVNYVFTGTVFVLDGNCTVSSRLVNVQTSKILLAKEASGRIENWLMLKSKLAEDIAQQLNQPLNLEDKYKKQPITTATLNQYGKILTTMDQGEVDKAAQMSALFEETNSEFPYFKDIQADIEKLKQRVSELENINKIITNAFELGDKAQEKSDYNNAVKFFEKFLAKPEEDEYTENRKLFALGKMAFSYYKLGDYTKAQEYAKKAQELYKFYPEANEVELLSLLKTKNIESSNNKFRYILDSLNFKNELRYRTDSINYLLRWEQFNGYAIGMKKRGEDEEALFYRGMGERGYGSNISNEIYLINLMKSNGLDYSVLKPEHRQYQKLERALLALDNPDIFATDQTVNYFILSLQYADDLYAQKKYPEYKAHLAKEIKRMEEYGTVCTNCGDPSKKVILSFSANKELQARFDKATKSLYKLGLSNSMQQFYEGFMLLYGDFVFRKLILDMQNKDLEAAARSYNSFFSVTVSKRQSYFYSYFWDIVLQLRKVTKDVNSRTPLSPDKFRALLNDKITRGLTEKQIPLQVFEEVKNYKLVTQKGSTIVEEDVDLSKSAKIQWSKNLGIIKDGKGQEFRYARSPRELKQLSEDNIPAYAYYDFDEDNGEAYGKLYNIHALRLIAANPPAGWKLASPTDFFKLLETGKNYADLSEDYLEGVTESHFLKVIFPLGGYYDGDAFCCMEEKAHYWTNEKIEEEPFRTLKVYEDGEIHFENSEEVKILLAVRLVKK